MAGNDIPASGDLVFKPSARAFFVHYVAMFLVFCGPPAQSGGGAARLAGDPPGAHCPGRSDLPEIRPGVPGNLPGGGPGARRWPSPRKQEIAWENLGEILVLRGLTQTILQVGNLAFRDKAGGPELFWYGLLNPKDVKDLIERKRS